MNDFIKFRFDVSDISYWYIYGKWNTFTEERGSTIQRRFFGMIIM